MSIEGRKAFSAEPQSAAAMGKRWEDLIEAATSATEADSDRDLTPVGLTFKHSIIFYHQEQIIKNFIDSSFPNL